MFSSSDAARILSAGAPSKPHAIDNIVMRKLMSACLRPYLFVVEASINLFDWRFKRDAIMDDSIWNIEGTKPYLYFPTDRCFVHLT